MNPEDKVFVDTDIILDLLARRSPHYTYAATLFSAAERGNLIIYASSLSIANLYYMLRKLKSREYALRHLRKLRLLARIVSVDEKTIDLALASDFNDLEDAVQNYAASENGIKVIITRNKKDFKKSRLVVCTAEEYLAMKLGSI